MHSRERQSLRKLYGKYLTDAPSSGHHPSSLEYIQSKFQMDITLERQLRVVDMYFPHIQGRVLEWGCHHGFDSCVLRMRLGDSIELFGCDVLDEALFHPIYESSGMAYTHLRHPYRLDYASNYFDVVISNGVLEHVPDDQHSIREICRILKSGGSFVVTCLPNRYSYTEAIQRLRNGPFHERLYTMRKARRMLQQNGFEVIDHAYFLLVPTMLGGFPSGLKKIYQAAKKPIWWLNDFLELLWPVNRLASNLMIVGRKVE